LDERTYSVLRSFRRLGLVYILVPALVVALVIAVGISGVLVKSFGRSMTSGLNGMVAGSIGSPSRFDDPAATKILQGDVQALVRLGSFASITVRDSRGRVHASAGSDQPRDRSLDKYERLALDKGKSSAYIARCECGDWEFMTVGPLTSASGGKPYGVVRGHRAIGVVLPTIVLTVTVFVLVVLIGATVAIVMLRRLITRTEEALDEDQRVINALDRRLKVSLRELEEHSVGTLQALVAAVDARDTYTAHHSLNVSDYACAIARYMGLSEELGSLERAGLLHDIGKIGVSEYALLKPGRLTAEETASIREHSEIGARIIEMAPFLSDIVPVVRHHHERWDGAGYPSGLAAEEIPLLSRILCVADALDAMTTDRSYRNALTLTKARQELVNGSGSQFDPQVVEVTVSLLDSRGILLPRRQAYATA
jgi:putative nucleotidyltransferase with HDIG domain